MELDEYQTNTFVPRPAMSDIPSRSPLAHSAEHHADTPNARVDPLELEALALVLEHSLNVHTTHQFYGWTQGLMQNLIQHELLICALRKGESTAFYVDTFSTTANEPAVISNLFGQDTSLVPHLIKTWEENHFQPVLFDMDKIKPTADSGLVRELNRLGTKQLLMHGTYDTAGRPISLFIFACYPGTIRGRRAHLVELLVPSLHTTWVHTQFARPTAGENTHSHANGHDLLTTREHEILGWIYRGKSNIEIAMILGLSPLTVKNHVQKILRRLDVLNRAQAVGKALSLRIIDGSVPG